MTMKVTITGTGMPLVQPHRAGPGVLVEIGDLALQFDAGRNTASRIVGAGVGLLDLNAVFLTHYHSDHVVGLADVVLTYWVLDFADQAKGLDIVAPNGHTMDYLDRMLDAWDHDLEVRAAHHGGGRSTIPRVSYQGFDVPDEPTEVWSRGDVRVLAGRVRHEPVIGAVGYRIESPDGVVAITGDTIVCDEVAALCEGADVVVYEAMRFQTYMDELPPEAQYINEYHADTRLIGEQMAVLEVPTVMLTHLIPPPETAEAKAGFAEDLRSNGYDGQIIVCDDLDTATLG
jgi:ribonuclease Z